VLGGGGGGGSVYRMEFVKYFNQNTIGNSHEDPKLK